MRANGAEVTFIPLKMEAGRGREMRGGGRRGSKGQREEHRDGAVNVKGGTRGTVDVRERKRREWAQEGWMWGRAHPRVLEVCWRLDAL